MTLDIDYRIAAPIRLDVTFEIRGFTALLGRSGAGKTSLLKALAGLLPAQGTPWAGLAPEVRPVGYMPQGAALFPHLTVLQNVAYPLRGATRFAQAASLLAELGIGDLAARGATTLSGGEAQRAALARACARRPALLLLDEPAAGLDAVTRDSVLLWLLDTIAARGIPALAATHDPAIAGLADWLVLLADGRIIQQGFSRDVFNRPETAAAAQLLGYQNIWEDDGIFRAIRAEDIVVAKTGIAATVISSRELGADLRLTCATPAPFTVIVKAAGKADFNPGQTVFLQLPPEKTVILNRPPRRTAAR